MVVSVVDEGEAFGELEEGVPEERPGDCEAAHAIVIHEIAEVAAVAVFGVDLALAGQLNEVVDLEDALVVRNEISKSADFTEDLATTCVLDAESNFAGAELLVRLPFKEEALTIPAMAEGSDLPVDGSFVKPRPSQVADGHRYR